MRQILLLILALISSTMIYGDECTDYLVVKTGDTITIFSIYVKADGTEKILKEVIPTKSIDKHPVHKRNELLEIVSEDYTYDSRDEILNSELCEKFQNKIYKERDRIFVSLRLKQDSLKNKEIENEELRSEVLFLKEMNKILEKENGDFEKDIITEERKAKFYKFLLFLSILFIITSLIFKTFSRSNIFKKEVRKN